MTTTGADDVRFVHLTAVGASHELRRAQRIVCAAAVAATFGEFSFWMWRHNKFLLWQRRFIQRLYNDMAYKMPAFRRHARHYKLHAIHCQGGGRRDLNPHTLRHMGPKPCVSAIPPLPQIKSLDDCSSMFANDNWGRGNEDFQHGYRISVRLCDRSLK